MLNRPGNDIGIVFQVFQRLLHTTFTDFLIHLIKEVRTVLKGDHLVREFDNAQSAAGEIFIGGLTQFLALLQRSDFLRLVELLFVSLFRTLLQAGNKLAAHSLGRWIQLIFQENKAAQNDHQENANEGRHHPPTAVAQRIQLFAGFIEMLFQLEDAW